MHKQNKKFAFDVIVSALGRFGTGFITLLLMPFYLPLLGKEAFGLFGFFMTIEVLFRIFEGGLGNAIVKDFSLRIIEKNNPWELLRSFEVAYIVLGLLQCIICMGVVLAGGFSFLDAKELSPELIRTCLLIMSLRFIFSSIAIIQNAFFQASEEIVALNIFRLGNSLCSSIGSIIILNLTGGDPAAFFSWWVFCSGLFALLKAFYNWRSNLGRFMRVKPVFSLLKAYKADQVKLIGLGLLAFISSKYPMWLVAYKLDLGAVGVFALASKVVTTLGSSISVMTKPLIARYTRDQIKDDSGGTILLRMTQLILIIAGFMVLTFGLLSQDIIGLWLKGQSFDPDIVAVVATYLLGTSFFTLVLKPYTDALQADRNLAVIYFRHILLIVIGVPLGFWACESYGIKGLVASFAFVSGLVAITVFPKISQCFLIEGGVFRRLILPLGGLAISALLLYGASFLGTNLPPLVRIITVGLWSGLLFLGLNFYGVKALKKKPTPRYI